MEEETKRLEFNKTKVITELARLSDDEFEELLDLAKIHSVKIKRRKLTEQFKNIENEYEKTMQNLQKLH